MATIKFTVRIPNNAEHLCNLSKLPTTITLTHKIETVGLTYRLPQLMFLRALVIESIKQRRKLEKEYEKFQQRRQEYQYRIEYAKRQKTVTTQVDLYH